MVVCKKVTCEFCGKKFSAKKAVIRHLKDNACRGRKNTKSKKKMQVDVEHDKRDSAFTCSYDDGVVQQMQEVIVPKVVKAEPLDEVDPLLMTPRPSDETGMVSQEIPDPSLMILKSFDDRNCSTLVHPEMDLVPVMIVEPSGTVDSLPFEEKTIGEPPAAEVPPLMPTARVQNLKCDQCPMVLLSEDALKAHTKTHTVPRQSLPDVSTKAKKRSRVEPRSSDDAVPPKKVKLVKNGAWCNRCGGKFSNRTAVYRHLQKNVCERPPVHEGEPDASSRDESQKPKCGRCGRLFVSLRNLRGHEKNAKCGKKKDKTPQIVPERCSDCDKTFEGVFQLNLHFLEHIAPRPASESCNENENQATVVKDEELRKFMAKYLMSTDKISCTRCGQTFRRKKALEEHLRGSCCSDEPNDGAVEQQTQSDKLTKMVCDLCGKTFKSSISLYNHIRRIRHDLKMVRNRDLWKIETFVLDGVKMWKCSRCSHSTNNRARLYEHLRIHTGEKPYVCNDCGKRFRTRHFIRLHITAVHINIRNHVCEVCGRAFSCSSFLRDHRRVHTGEKPYCCDLCGKTFSQSGSLFSHKQAHMNARNHECHLCAAKFITKARLQKHLLRYHAKVKNYYCAQCGKGFFDRMALREHESVHSTERPFSCDICGATFKLRKTLRQHWRTHRPRVK